MKPDELESQKNASGVDLRPFLDETKSKKLIHFTEKAAGVVSERERLPMKQNIETLKHKL